MDERKRRARAMPGNAGHPMFQWHKPVKQQPRGSIRMSRDGVAGQLKAAILFRPLLFTAVLPFRKARKALSVPPRPAILGR
jgi:hypothetical protein